MSKRTKVTFDIMTISGKKKISFFQSKPKLIVKKGMNIKIHLTKDEINHIYPIHTFFDECSQVEDIMKKIQKELKRRLK